MSKEPIKSTVSLADKYEKMSGQILINGSQAITRLPLLQKILDQQAGLNTGGYISGYRGSPVGGLDSSFWRESKRFTEHNINFQPGVNEDLAATAIWGTQQLDSFEQPNVDGVFCLWYGKAPGVDRSCDVLRHANFAGTHKNGGVLTVYGDDQPGKSSTIVCQSEQTLASLQIPSLFPSNVDEIIEFGLKGWAMSRYTGLWIGLKCVNETVEQTKTVDLALEQLKFVMPENEFSQQPHHILDGFLPPMMREKTVKKIRLPLVHAFVKANNIDKIFGTGRSGLGIVTSGKSYGDVKHALSLLGLETDILAELGVAIYKVGCIWPLEPSGLIEFSKNRSELFFVEEKDSIMESQAAHILINRDEKIKISGKKDPEGQALLAVDGILEPLEVARILAKRLIANSSNLASELPSDFYQRVKNLLPDAFNIASTNSAVRMPYFCSGCPHNTSTQLPEGSKAMSGIGCHTMAVFKRTDTLAPTQMGGEGMNWAGVANFVDCKHMFQNLGDGTYFHSGLLAIRAAIAAKVNITYKILFNDVTAMTGGQPIDGPISVGSMAQQVMAEGVNKCVVVTDNVSAYTAKSGLPNGVTVFHRSELDTVQKQLREISGATVLIYEQTCAAAKRRRRKKGQYPDPAKRMFINPAVCENCGDCSKQSTCVSITPKTTEFGTKREIDQSSCNKDFTCNTGFCPSFVTVKDAAPKKPTAIELSSNLSTSLPAPECRTTLETPFKIMITGIGGTGVITVGAVLGMAAHIEEKATSIYDMTGLSQKNGAVYSHLIIAKSNQNITNHRVGYAEANLVIAFDIIAALSGDAAITYHQQETQLVGNIDTTPTADFQFDRDNKISSNTIKNDINQVVSENNQHLISAASLATQLLGDSIGTNMFVVGYALQKGLLPLTVSSIEQAIELNGTSIEFNLKALNYGRLFAHDPQAILRQLTPTKSSTKQQTLAQLITHRYQHLSVYQSKTYADTFKTQIDKISACEPTSQEQLTKAVVISLSKLMSYKDEYEIARLYSHSDFIDQLRQQFQPGFKLSFNLAPPLLSKKDPHSGHAIKKEYGGWMLTCFKYLAKCKGLRGSALDLFGYTQERRSERKLISTYQQDLNLTLAQINEDNYEMFIELLSLPEQIRGFGHIKEKAIMQYHQDRETLLSKIIS